MIMTGKLIKAHHQTAREGLLMRCAGYCLNICQALVPRMRLSTSCQASKAFVCGAFVRINHENGSSNIWVEVVKLFQEISGLENCEKTMTSRQDPKDLLGNSLSNRWKNHE